MTRLFEREADMTAPVRNWLRQAGCTVWAEQPIFGHVADLLAVEWHAGRCMLRLQAGPLAAWTMAERYHKLLQDLPDWYPLFKRIIGIELKLTGWRDAIAQARAYQMGCTETYVALPKDRLDRQFDRIAHECGMSGVGLLSVAPEHVEGLLRPERHQHTLPTEAVRLAEKGWQIWRKERAEHSSENVRGGRTK